ncbi:MAG: RHS repeat-associated core domain-containing protein [Polyangiaceae bacterium]|nr:RHS repeat-associated core domain-containing protein [Polyangiaceae bacterium]
MAGNRQVAEVSRQEHDGVVDPDQVRYLTSDHLGSTRIVTDEHGDVVETRRYDAFGDPESTFASGPTAGYTGHRHDDGLGLVNMRGRLYDARVGRFLLPDPFVMEPLDPAGWNRYGYVKNDPFDFLDRPGARPHRWHPAARGAQPRSRAALRGLAVVAHERRHHWSLVEEHRQRYRQRQGRLALHRARQPLLERSLTHRPS